MAVVVTHTKVSGVSDGADATLIRPSDWNAGHTLADVIALSDLQSGQLINEIQNFPAIEPADGAQPEWWEESAGTATLTEEDVAGEGITETYLRALKLVTTADVYAYQRYTYATEKRLKSGRVISCTVAVWSVGETTAAIEVATSAGVKATATTTTAGWTIIRIENITLDGTYLELRLKANNGTAYFVPLGLNIGPKAFALRPRGLAYRFVDSPPAIKTLTGLGDEATWTDIDLTASTSALAAIALLTHYLVDAVDNFDLAYRRNGSSDDAVTNQNRVASIQNDVVERDIGQRTVLLDDQQIFEYYLDRYGGSTILDFGEIYLNGWLEWE